MESKIPGVWVTILGSVLFQQGEHQFGQVTGQGAATASLSFADIVGNPAEHRPDGRFSEFKERLLALQLQIAEFEWAPDLGQNIGSMVWFRGFTTLCALCVGAYLLWPGMNPIKASVPALSAQTNDELRSQMILPLAFGGDTGRTMGATDAVIALKQSPERPALELAATIGRGDSFMRVLQRAGVGGGDATEVANLVGNVMPVSDLKDGTRLDLVLGRRASRNQPRPVDALSFRARFDLNVEITRQGGELVLTRKPIIVDDTPLRIRGTVGSSLYRSARAAGAPAKAVQAYLQTLGTKMSVGRDIRATDEFDIIIAYKRAETGETEMGELLYAGLVRGDKPRAQMLRWQSGGRSQFFEASGVGEDRGEFARPVGGAVSSGFGMRRHPILGYRRMHSGLDFRAGYGTPILATADGVVNYAGRKGGYGNFVKINHGNGLATGYAHMSRFAVSNGTRVRQGQVIGYVGSTGLSTGPHLHYELYRNNRAIDPRSVKFTSRAELTGRDLANFKARLNQLLKVTPGAALQSLAAPVEVEPQREIERISGTHIV